jgi:hypothetical protein
LNIRAIPQLLRQYTTQPPEFNIWGTRLHCKSQDESPQDLALAGAGELDYLSAPKVAVGCRVEGFFKSSVEASDGEWFPGEVISRNSRSGSWQVKFDDGEEHNFEANDPDLRLESSGPWTTWLDTYMPGLLLSAYRAARRTPTQLEMRFFNMLQHPEQFSDSPADIVGQFQPRNFCDVERLCNTVNLCNDADSVAETPAKKGRRSLP